MSEYVGVDWASKGWLTVSIDDGDWLVRMYPSLYSVWFSHRNAEVILVDIPIGLPESARRECDKQAKAFLPSERRSSVFWTPCRDAIQASTYEQAKEANIRCRDDSLSSQSWGLIPRIQEADHLLRSNSEARDTIRESHPEVCFDAFRQKLELNSKHNDQGIDDRLQCLDQIDDTVSEKYEHFVEKYIESQPRWARRIGSSNRNDILDAMVLALTAKLGADDLDTLPESPP